MRRDPRCGQGFSIVEIVMGLAIMSILLGVTVTTYRDSVGRARKEVARDEARAIRSAIQRWQLQHHRPYPFETIYPLVPQYLRNVKNDPWGGGFRIDPQKKVVYSLGPNGLDDGGEGDDVGEYFDTTGDVPPGPPQGLTVRLVNQDIVVDFQPPIQNRDGSSPVVDLSHYRVSLRPSDSTSSAVWIASIPAGSDTDSDGCPDPPYKVEDTGTPDLSDRRKSRNDVGSIFGLPTEEALDKSYYFTARAIDCAGNESYPSNQAGLFVAKEVEPRIVTFRPSSYTPAVSSAFSFFLEVTDADSNLDRVELRRLGDDAGTTVEWTTQLAQPFKIESGFRFLRNYAPEPALMAETGEWTDVKLYAVDASGNTTERVLSTPIKVINRPPVVTALNPGIQLLTVNPSATQPVHIDFTFEANDQENNLTRMYFRWIDEASPGTPVAEFEYDLVPAGSIMVRTTGLDFDITDQKDYYMEVVAEDSLGALSTPRKAKVLIKEDTTPPDALAMSLDPSNHLLATQPFVGWFIRDPDQLAVHLEAFEIESPPITYELRITTEALEVDGGAFHSVPQINQDSGYATHPGWLHIPHADLGQGGLDAGDIILSTANGLLDAPFIEDEPYFIGMRAMNASGLTNFTTTVPLHQTSYQRQYPFRLDMSPPIVTEVEIEGIVDSFNTTWITDLLDAEWTVRDPVGGNLANTDVGSGPDLYKYRLTRREPADPVGSGAYIPPPVIDWQEVQTLELNSVALPASDPTSNGKDIVLEILARDRAGNWSTVPVSSAARLDFTSPDYLFPPVITNQVDDVISVLDTFSASWGPPGSVQTFEDNESGIESWEWGIATTSIFVGFPGIFGWQPVISAITSSSISQNNLLVNGDKVHAVVRARNYTGSVSVHAASTAALVDASLFTSLKGFPSSGISPLSVEFTATVTGGVPPYDVTFQFDGTNRLANTVPTSQSTITTSWTYDLVNDDQLPRPEIICRLIIRDQEGRESRKDFLVDVREDALMAVAVEDHRLVQVMSMDGDGNFSPLMTVKTGHQNSHFFNLQEIGVEPRGSWMVAVSSEKDVVQHLRLSELRGNEVAPQIVDVAGVSGSSAASDHNAWAFRQGIPRGVLLQTFHPPDSWASGSPGFMRMSIFEESGRVAGPEFGYDDGLSTQRRWLAAAPHGESFDEGLAAIQDDPTYTSLRHLSDIDITPTDPIDPVDSELLPATLPEAVATLDIGPPHPLPAPALPTFGTRMVGTRLGPWLLSQSNSGLSADDQGILRIRPGSDGIAAKELIPFTAPQKLGGLNGPTGLLSVSHDGEAYAFAVGAVDAWRVAMGRTREDQFYVSGDPAEIAWNLVNLSVDAGGTMVAMALRSSSDHGRVRVSEVDHSGVSEPVHHVEGASGVHDWDADFALSSNLSILGPVRVSDVKLFRRPNNGHPYLQEVFDFTDDGDTASDSTQLDGIPLLRDDTEVLFRGTNMDLVDRVVFRHVSSDTRCPVTVDSAVHRTGLPPTGAWTPNVPHYPPEGDVFHFLRMQIPLCLDAQVASGAEEDVEFILEQDAGVSIYRSSWTSKVIGTP